MVAKHRLREGDKRMAEKMTGYQCFHCLEFAVSWDSDFSFEDMMIDGEGIVHMCHCNNCGALIEYYVPFKEGKDEDIQG